MSDPVPTEPCRAFRPVIGKLTPFQDDWRSETVQGLLRGIQEDHGFDRMAILADALEEAGCDDEQLLRHCRECQNHLPECWALSACLGRRPIVAQARVATPAQVAANEVLTRFVNPRGRYPTYGERSWFHEHWFFLTLVLLLLLAVVGLPTVVMLLQSSDTPATETPPTMLKIKVPHTATR